MTAAEALFSMLCVRACAMMKGPMHAFVSGYYHIKLTAHISSAVCVYNIPFNTHDPDHGDEDNNHNT
jgi:hypothetical protein